jgi:hypothetical protein
MLTINNQSFPDISGNQNHSEVFVLPGVFSPKAVLSTSFVSGAVFLRVKQNLTQRYCLSNQPLQKCGLNATINTC